MPRFTRRGGLGSDARTLAEAIDERIAALQAWLRENAPDVRQEQKHLDAGTREQAYWHYGYLSALLDARAFLRRKGEEST